MTPDILHFAPTIAREHQRDLLREAANERLARLATHGEPIATEAGPTLLARLATAALARLAANHRHGRAAPRRAAAPRPAEGRA